MKSAAIGVGTLLNGGFINCLSQTAEGYRLAKVRVTIRVRVKGEGAAASPHPHPHPTPSP